MFSSADFTREEVPVTQEIVAPEPQSQGDWGNGWEHIPRWLRVVLTVIAIAAMILLVYLTR
jgi:hypothetical protein